MRDGLIKKLMVQLKSVSDSEEYTRQILEAFWIKAYSTGKEAGRKDNLKSKTDQDGKRT